MQDAMTDILVFAYAGLVTGNVGLEKIFCYTVFIEKLSFDTDYHFSNNSTIM